VIQNNLIFQNKKDGIGTRWGSTPLIQNNTIAYNEGSGIVCHVVPNPFPIIQNNIVGGNNKNGIYCFKASPSLDYNCVWGNKKGNYYRCSPGENDLSSNPRFVNPGEGDYSLYPFSPCIDKGWNADNLPSIDIAENPRIVDGVVDIGAYEFQGVEEDPEGPVFLYRADGTLQGRYSKINDAIYMAQPGAKILVHPGVYKESIYIKKSITLKAKEPGCIIDAEEIWDADGVLFSGSEAEGAVIEGFVIKGANWAGIACIDGADVVIQNNIIKDSKANGVFIRDTSPIIQNNIIINNLRGIRCGGQRLIPQIQGNIIVKNLIYGILCEGRSAPLIQNNTIAFNKESGIGCYHSSSPTIQNNIVTNNTNFGILKKDKSSPEIDYNCVWENDTNYHDCSPGKNDLSSNPHFVNPEADDYHLTFDSPCIDKGWNADDLPYIDIAGNRRIVNEVVDIGAYEFQGSFSITGKIICPNLKKESLVHIFIWREDKLRGKIEKPLMKFSYFLGSKEAIEYGLNLEKEKRYVLGAWFDEDKDQIFDEGEAMELYGREGNLYIMQLEKERILYLDGVAEGLRLKGNLTEIDLPLLEPIKPWMKISPSSSMGLENKEFKVRLKVEGGRAPYIWSVVKGELPDGLSFDRESGKIDGVAKEAGEYTFTVRVKDSLGAFAEAEANIRISKTALTLKDVVVYPNPFKPAKGHTHITFGHPTDTEKRLTKEAKIKIYTLNGECVAVIEERDGDGVAKWYATNKEGTPVASGIYIYIITNPAGQRCIGKIGIIR
jgi:parallel beta-helix repeat protein